MRKTKLYITAFLSLAPALTMAATGAHFSTDVPTLDPTNQDYLKAFCAYHGASPICIVKPNPQRPPASPVGGEIPSIPGAGGPLPQPTPFAGCGTQAQLCFPPTGKSVAVSGSGQLQAALNNAAPGDHLILSGGTYSGKFTFNKNGSATSPIVIQGGAGAPVFTGSFTLGGSYAVLTRVRFQRGTILITGHHIRISRNGFGDAGGGDIITMNNGPHMCNRVDHNEFRSFHGKALEISAMRNAAQHQGHRIDHNLFFDHHVAASEEVARMLTDAYDDAYITFDNNLFDRVLQGDRNQSETISMKTARQTLLGNTITNSGNAGFTFRETNRSLAEANYLDGGSRMEVMGDDNVVKGNIFSNGSSLHIRGGDGTMDMRNPGCKKSGLVPVTSKCTGVHSASRRTQVTDNIGPISVGDLYSGNTYKAQDTVLTNNSGPVKLLAGQENTHVTPGNPTPQAHKLTTADVGFSVGDSSCSGN